MIEETKAKAARTWFGYGRWDAPYWFIGKEPGGSDDAENYEAWDRLGANALIDCREHDLEYRGPDSGKWHVAKPGRSVPLQPTWRPLIALLLSYCGDASYDIERIRGYQVNHWGRLDGVTCVVELSAVAAPTTTTTDSMRLKFLDERIETLKEKNHTARPAFVLFYGSGFDPVYRQPYLDYWQRLAGVNLSKGDPKAVDQTIFCYTDHPTAYGTTNAYWFKLGKTMAQMRNSLDRQ